MAACGVFFGACDMGPAHRAKLAESGARQRSARLDGPEGSFRRLRQRQDGHAHGQKVIAKAVTERD